MERTRAALAEAIREHRRGVGVLTVVTAVVIAQFGTRVVVRLVAPQLSSAGGLFAETIAVTVVLAATALLLLWRRSNRPAPARREAPRMVEQVTVPPTLVVVPTHRHLRLVPMPVNRD